MRPSVWGSWPSWGVCTSTSRKSLWSSIAFSSAGLRLVYAPPGASMRVLAWLPVGVVVASWLAVAVVEGRGRSPPDDESQPARITSARKKGANVTKSDLNALILGEYMVVLI